MVAPKCVFASYYPAIKHDVMVTEDDVIEVLSPGASRIDALGQAAADEKAAGKSTECFDPEDRDKLGDFPFT